MGTSISAGTIMAYMDLDMSSFNSAIDMTAEQLLRLRLRWCGGRAGFHRRGG